MTLLAPLRLWWREIASPDYRVVLGQVFVARWTSSWRPPCCGC